MTGYVIAMGFCIACGECISFNPIRVPSITVEGSREPLCRACVDRWNEIHRTSKGLAPVVVHPSAYEHCKEEEL